MFESLKTTIDAGVKMCGSAEALAEVLETTPANLAHVKAGRRGLTPRQCALLARTVRVDPPAVLALDAVQREKDATQRAALWELLFKRASLGACLAFIIGATLWANESAAAEIVGLDNIYISVLMLCISFALRTYRASPGQGRDRALVLRT